MLAVVLVDAGLAIGFVGLVSILRPLRFLRIATRRRGALVAAIGLASLAAGMLLPAPTARATTPVTRLDEFMPAWQFAERHSVRIAAPPERVLAAVRAVTAGEIRLFRLLTWIRNPRRPWIQQPESILAPPAERPILDVALGSGFHLLAEEPGRELVIGTLVMAPAELRTRPPAELARLREEFTATKFQALAAPGYAKATMSFHLTDLGDGSTLLVTETRVFATDAATCRRFARYWRLIYPGSSILRRTWLRAIAKRAEGPRTRLRSSVLQLATQLGRKTTTTRLYDPFRNSGYR